MSFHFSRPRRCFEFGSNQGNKMACILPSSFEHAATTCVLTIQGPRAVGTSVKTHNWGLGVRTRLLTNGEHPSRSYDWRDGKGGWITATSAEAAETLLQCFDLTVEDVLSHYGTPVTGETYTLHLADVVADLG